MVFLYCGGIVEENLGGSTNADSWLRANNNTKYMHNEFVLIVVKQTKKTPTKTQKAKSEDV